MAGQQQYDNTNRGALFPNQRKQDGDNRPDFTGKINIDGTEYFISGWWKTGQRGEYMSLARQNEKPQQPGQQPQGGGGQAQGGPYRGGQPGQYRRPAPPPARNPIGDDKQFSDADIPF